MYSVRLGSRLRNGELAPLFDDDIAAIAQEEKRRETQAEIDRLLRELASEHIPKPHEPEMHAPGASNVVPLHRIAMHGGECEADAA